MARTGNFGRLPRALPNISNTLIAIMREEEHQRDANIMDAWEKGGTFEGRKATDGIVLAYWKDKMKDIAENDPLYEGARNNVLQLQYGIEQSKQDLLHVQGKISDGQYAQFFLNWAKKIPKDSEFYRTLQKNAAQLNERVKARSRAEAERAKSEAFESYANGIQKSYIADGQFMIDAFTAIARENNIIGQTEDLSNFMLKGQADPLIMEQVLDLMNAAKNSNPAVKAYFDQIRKVDPSFSGTLSSSYLSSHLAKMAEGYKKLEVRAIHDGYQDWVKYAKQGGADARALGVQVKAWPTGATYTLGRDEFDSAFNDPHATDADKVAAADEFAKSLIAMAQNKDLPPYQRDRLLNDAAALMGDPAAKPIDSFFENFLGLKGGGGGKEATGGTESEGGSQTGEVARWQAQLGMARGMQALMDSDPLNYTYASIKPGSNPPALDETGKGTVGIISKVAVQNSTTPMEIVPTVTSSGKAIMVASNVVNVYAMDALTGKKSSAPVGKAIVYNNGGVQKTLYSVEGSNMWTAVAPWSPGTTVRRDGQDIILTPPAVPADFAAKSAAALDANLASKGYASNFGALFNSATPPVEGATWTLEGPKLGKGQSGEQKQVTITVKNGQLVSSESITYHGANGVVTGTSKTPETAAVPIDWKTVVTDQSRLKAGHNPALDFETPSMAALTANGMSPDQVRTLWNNPSFQSQLREEELKAAGNDVFKYQALAARNASIANNVMQYGPASLTNPYINIHVPAQRRTDLLYPTSQGDAQYEEHSATKLATISRLKLPEVPSGMKAPQMGGLSPDERDAQRAAALKVQQAAVVTPTPTVSPTSGAIAPPKPLTTAAPKPPPATSAAPKPPTMAPPNTNPNRPPSYAGGGPGASGV